MDNRKIDAQNIQITYAKKEASETNQISKKAFEDDIYHGELDPSLIRDECLFEIFENTADSYPSRPAIVFQNKEYSYEEIDSSSNRLAWYLRDRGIQTGDKVGLILEKSAELYIAMLGILKSGAAYVPIDSGYPEDRVKYIIENSGISLTVTSSTIAGFLGLYDSVVLLDHECDLIDKFPDRRLNRTETDVTPNDLAYIIYTSGSTGRPKGVQIEHKSVCNLVRASQKIYLVKPEDKIYQGFTVAFDASIEEIWMAFGHGAALVPQTQEMQKAGPNLGKLLNDARITILSCVPTLLSMMTEDIPSLRLVIFGGEACPQHLIEKWNKPGRRLMNTYGPTEATVIATYSELKLGKKVTIGRPLPNYSVYIMSEDNSFAPFGDAGELLIGGIGLARGYIGREDLNKEKFIENPEYKTPKDPERLYRTGDLARFDQNGEIEFLGRIDSQVKIRGFRVELSEIESVINSVKGVRASVVTVHDSPSGIQKLAAYVVPEGKKEGVDLANIYQVLKEKLPNYMVPQYIDFIDEIPVLPSGKADRKSLPLPNESIRAIKSGTEVKPRNAVEAKIAEVWKSVFKIDSISIKDHFFNDLGGHSLFAAHAVSALRKDPKMAFLNFSDIYERPTVEQLAEKVTSHKSVHSSTVADREKTFLSASPIKHALCGIGQTSFIYVVWALISIPFLGIFYTLLSDTLLIDKVQDIIAILLILAVGYLPFVFTMSIATKWLVIGRYKPGRYPLWGSYYFRCWFVGVIQSLAPASVFTGTPLMAIYLRLMGAKVGTDCYIGTNHIQSYDLISIGDRSSIGLDTQLMGYTVEDGYLVLGNVEIGNECYIGTHSVVSPGTKMEDGSMLLEQSMLSEGANVPAGETWSGSPASVSKPDNDVLAMKASFKTVSNKRKAIFTIGHFAATYLYGFIFGIAALPVLFGLYLLYLDYNLWTIAFSPVAAVISILLVSTEIAVTKRIILGRAKPGVYGIYSAYYFRKSLVDHLVHMTLSVLHTVYATLYIVPFLRALGTKIGKRAEISTVSHFSPDLLYIGDESFFADASMAGTPKIYMNQTMFAEAKIGKRTFIGNSALVPLNTTIGDNCLIGVLSLPPNEKVTPPGTSWLGTPAMYLHKRDINTSFSETQTYSPTRLLYAKRLTIEFFRIILPSTVFYFSFMMLLLILGYMDVYMHFWETVLLFPFIMFAFGVATALFVVFAKLILIGTYTPNVQPLWSTFVWKTELVTGLYETISVPILSLFRGTPLISWFLRLFGCKIGKRVYIATTHISEFDLVNIEDEAAINFNSTMQTHLFEDRVMKMSDLTVGKRCTVGNEAIVLYDTVMEEGSKLGALSLLMKGETLPAWTTWEGNPAKLNDEPVVLYDKAMQTGSTADSPLPLIKGEKSPLWAPWKMNPNKLKTVSMVLYDTVLEEESTTDSSSSLNKGENKK